MKVFTKSELMSIRKKIYSEFKDNLFIYPTDHGYNIGCDATNEVLVNKLREIKKTTTQPFSIIPPSKKWIYNNCHVSYDVEVYVKKLGERVELEGKKHCVTLILKLKNKDCVAKSVINGLDTIAVKIPEHWFSNIVEELDIPIISTSANTIGGNFISSLDYLNDNIKNNVAIAINDGEKIVHPMTIINTENL